MWDARMYEMFGIPEGTPITSELWKSMIHPEDLHLASGIFCQTVQQRLRERHSFRIIHPVKGIRFIRSAQELVLDPEGRPVACVGIDQDVTESNAMRDKLLARQAELETMSLTDPLTGVGNRRKLDDGLAREISRVRRYGGKMSLLMADLDRFKSINDEFGHETGDSVLRTISRTLARMVRDTDLVARMGGDEFCIVMPDVDAADAKLLGDRIQARFERARVHPLTGRLTASIGVAQLRAGENAESLLRRADQAMYRAKTSGRNQVCSDFGDEVRCAVEAISTKAAPGKNIGPSAKGFIRCVHCFAALGSAEDAAEHARPERRHRCIESLLAKQATACQPFN
jgi:diguanylate cyclase (GGDEF)-like protein